jgi:cysteine desulfurase
MIYLDNNATTQPLPEVVEAVASVMRDTWGNPSSPFAIGKSARRILEESRHSIAGFFTVRDHRLVFTSGATESIRTVANCLLPKEKFVFTNVEHSVVFAASRCLPSDRVNVIPVDADGQPDWGELEKVLGQGPALVTVTTGNNETGILVDLRMAVLVCSKYRARLHLDATQAVSRIDVSSLLDACDFLTASAHKFHGPRGCGLLFVREGTRFSPMFPGTQEGGWRAGTENLPAIAGTAAALQSQCDWSDMADKMKANRKALESSMLRHLPSAEIHGMNQPRLPNTTSIYIPGCDAATIVQSAASCDLILSAGSACSNSGRPSHVILAMGHSKKRAAATLRLSLSRNTTPEEVESATALIVKLISESPRVA